MHYHYFPQWFWCILGLICSTETVSVLSCILSILFPQYCPLGWQVVLELTVLCIKLWDIFFPHWLDWRLENSMVWLDRRPKKRPKERSKTLIPFVRTKGIYLKCFSSVFFKWYLSLSFYLSVSLSFNEIVLVGISEEECFNSQQRGRITMRGQWRYNVSIDARSKQGIAFHPHVFHMVLR